MRYLTVTLFTCSLLTKQFDDFSVAILLSRLQRCVAKFFVYYIDISTIGNKYLHYTYFAIPCCRIQRHYTRKLFTQCCRMQWRFTPSSFSIYITAL